MRTRSGRPAPARAQAAGRIGRALVAVVAAVAGSGCAANPRSAAGNYYGDRPTSAARVDQAAFDFGTVEPGTVVRHQFQVVNTGDHPLDFIKVTPGCGCTVVKPLDKTVWPGHAGVVEVTLETRGLSGPQSKAVRIRTNEPGRPEIEFRLFGDVATDILAKPQRIVLGRAGQPTFGSVEVIVLDRNATVTAVKSQYGQLELHSAPLPAPARGVKIVVTPRGTGLSGLFNDRIIVTTTSPRQPKVVIPVMGSL